jgi:hypothetical protein
MLMRQRFLGSVLLSALMIFLRFGLQAESFKQQLMRHERLRFYMAAAAGILCAWLSYQGLKHLAAWLGIQVWVNFDQPHKIYWMTDNGAWTEEWLSGASTPAGILLHVFSLVLTYYSVRITYHCSVSLVLTRRDLWLITGWLGYTVLAIAIFQIGLLHLFEVLETHPVLESLSSTWIGGVVGFLGFLVFTNLFARSWRCLMRRKNIPPQSGRDR